MVGTPGTSEYLPGQHGHSKRSHNVLYMLIKINLMINLINGRRDSDQNHSNVQIIDQSFLS